MKTKMITFSVICLIIGGLTYQSHAISRTDLPERSAIYQKSDSVHTIVDESPEFPGGEGERTKFIAKALKYPIKAQEKKAQGRVVCSFIIEADGKITDVQVARGVDPELDKEAIRVIQSMPKWEPGKHNGKPVRVRYTLPILFRVS